MLLKRIGRPIVERLAAFAGSIIAVRTAAPRVVLTFDDGPEPGGTDEVLSALAGHHATATFFVLLERARRHRSLLAEMMAAGHELALHGVDHQPLPRFGFEATRARTAAAAAELADLTGQEIRWFRPPYGRQTPANWRGIRAAGLVSVLWGATTWDWREVTPAERLAKALDGVRPGTIVLAHDGFAGPADGADEAVAHTLDRTDLINSVLSAYAERGWSAVSLTTALERGRAIMAGRFSR